MSFPPKVINDVDFVRMATKSMEPMQFWASDGAGSCARNAVTANFWDLATAAGVDDPGAELILHDGTDIGGGAANVKMTLDEVVFGTATTPADAMKIEFWYGTGLFAAATLWTEVSNCSPGGASSNFPISSPAIPCNNKIWARCRGIVGGETQKLLAIGLHLHTV